jgi:hemoglobin
MVDLWSSTLRGSARFRGAPMPEHTALPSRDADKLAGVA